MGKFILNCKNNKLFCNLFVVLNFPAFNPSMLMAAFMLETDKRENFNTN